MAKSPSDPRRPLLVAAALIAMPPAGAAIIGTIPTGEGKPPVKYQCDHASMDYGGGLLHLRGNVRIWQGDISVAADQADATGNGHEFKTSHWVFGGKVHVRSESQGDLHADHATVEIAMGELRSAVVSGSPALFEQTRPMAGRMARGHAATIDYEVAAHTVTLSGDAVLSDDRSGEDLRGETMTYNVRDMVVEAEGGPGSRARMTVTPGSAPEKKP